MCSRRFGIFLAVSPALFACLLSLPAHGQEPAWTLTGAAFSASVEQLQAAAARVPAEKFSEATVLLERDVYQFDAENRVTYKHR